MIDTSYDQLGAATPVLVPVTASEWLCKQVTHSLFFSSFLNHWHPSSWMIDTSCGQWHFKSGNTSLYVLCLCSFTLFALKSVVFQMHVQINMYKVSVIQEIKSYDELLLLLPLNQGFFLFHKKAFLSANTWICPGMCLFPVKLLLNLSRLDPLSPLSTLFWDTSMPADRSCSQWDFKSSNKPKLVYSKPKLGNYIQLVLCALLFEMVVFPTQSCSWLWKMHKVSVNKDMKNQSLV